MIKSGNVYKFDYINNGIDELSRLKFN